MAGWGNNYSNNYSIFIEPLPITPIRKALSSVSKVKTLNSKATKTKSVESAA